MYILNVCTNVHTCAIWWIVRKIKTSTMMCLLLICNSSSNGISSSSSYCCCCCFCCYWAWLATKMKISKQCIKIKVAFDIVRKK